MQELRLLHSSQTAWGIMKNPRLLQLEQTNSLSAKCENLITLLLFSSKIINDDWIYTHRGRHGWRCTWQRSHDDPILLLAASLSAHHIAINVGNDGTGLAEEIVHQFLGPGTGQVVLYCTVIFFWPLLFCYGKLDCCGFACETEARTSN